MDYSEEQEIFNTLWSKLKEYMHLSTADNDEEWEKALFDLNLIPMKYRKRSKSVSQLSHDLTLTIINYLENKAKENNTNE